MNVAVQGSRTADAVIVGGGPAGLATAIALRRKGAECLVVEALAPGIDKCCGEGLMPDALEALSSLGVAMAPDEGRVFHGIRFINRRHRAEAVFPTRGGLGVRRTHLHRRLVAAAQDAGVRIAWKTHVRLVDRSSMLVEGVPLKFRWLIGADGQSSAVRRWAGLDTRGCGGARYGFRRHYQVRPWSDVVEVHWGASGQVYITPVAEDCVCVAFVTRDARLGREDWLAGYPELQARLNGARIASRERGALTATRRLGAVARDNVALVGDASGSVDAVTGEGLAICFRQAIALADAVAIGDLAAYGKAHRALGRLPHTMARLLLCMDRWPALEQRAMRTLDEHPKLFQELLAVHVGAASLPRFAVQRAPRLAWGLLQPTAP